MSLHGHKKKSRPARKDTPFRRELKARKGLAYGFGASSIAGTHFIEARHEDCAAPVATLWFRWAGNKTLDISGMYTPSFARKCGVQGWLWERLLASYPDIVRVITASDTRYSRRWLRVRGFKRNNDGDLEVRLQPC